MDVVAFSALGYIVTGLLLAMMLARKPHLPKKRKSYGQADSGVLWLSAVMLALCIFVAFSSAYISAHSEPEPEGNTANIGVPHGQNHSSVPDTQ
jgi:H+/Cl- antiporter ClcA